MDPTIDTELDPGDAGHTLSDDVVNTVPGDLDPVDIEIDDLIGSALREAQAARGGRRGQGARRSPPRLTTLIRCAAGGIQAAASVGRHNPKRDAPS